MFSSRHERKLMDGRKVIWRAESLGVSPAGLTEFLSSYKGDHDALLLGYWEYGDEIILTTPDDPINARDSKG